MYQDQEVREHRMQRAAERQGFVLKKSRHGDPRALGHDTWTITPLPGTIAGSIVGEGLSLDEVEARLTEEMTEEQANEEGLFDCPTCGRLRGASEMTTGAADEWAASLGVKLVRTRPNPRPGRPGTQNFAG
jgi:hypothetical protein